MRIGANSAARGLFAADAVMWVGRVASRWMRPGVGDPAWAAPLFLKLGCDCSDGSWSVAALVLFAGGGLAIEWIGVHTGIPFGRYSTRRVGLGCGRCARGDRG
jgi:uncharacterized membrane protein